MKKAVLKKANPLSHREEDVAQIPMQAQDYLYRVDLLRKRMEKDGVDTAVLYGDREHFSNIEYFSGYDCRFEEALFIIPQNGAPTLLVGNEGMSYSGVVPYEIRRVYYRNFSLQGQPRRAEERLNEILREASVQNGAQIGLIGFKYFDAEFVTTDPKYTFDVPHYIVEILRQAAGAGQVRNYTEALTGLDGGIRLRVYHAREIAAAEAAAARSANVVLRLLKNLRPGMTEYSLAESARAGFAPLVMHPLTNFGPESVSVGIRSPLDSSVLALGDVCGVCYGVRGSLTSRVGVAAHDQASMKETLRPLLFSFYGKFFEAMCAWYAQVRVNANGNALHHAVHDIIGGPEYNVQLNCGHFTGQDEWVNSLSYDGSKHTLPDGAYLQVDIIASNPDPTRTAICEDTMIVAGPALRAQLEQEYPEVHARIQARRNAMGELGIELHEDALPLSNLNGVMFPFLLNLDVVFGIE
ncbi:MAG: aminopeptidase P family N-terminal domain-containing protein [Clostridia bacterium]|nr:aminopeptidase P family N-terminal domain-containing protein [Clostridia bacterium]